MSLGPKVNILVATLLLLIPVMINAFPFVYYDTGFYLHYANHLFEQPIMLFRPLVYSAFLKITHSLILTVVLQSLWLNILLYKTAVTLEFSRKYYWLVVLISVILTPIAIYSGFILPDVFIAVQALALFNLLYIRSTNYWNIFFGLSFIFASMAHYSNLILSCLAVLLILFFKTKRKLAAVFILPLLILPTFHFMFWNEFAVTDSAYFFIFSRLTATNVSQIYLKEKCKIEKVGICVVLSKGFDPWDLSPESAIQQAGGQASFQKQIRVASIEIFSRPDLVLKFFAASTVNWGKQFISFAGPPENSFNDRVVPQELAEFNPWEFSLFARQSFFNTDILTDLYLVVVIMNLIIFILLRKKLKTVQIEFFKFLLLCLVLNSFVCGVLTAPSDRYQGRLVFLFPFFMIYIVAQKFTSSPVDTPNRTKPKS